MEDDHWFDGRHQLHFLQREDYIYLPPTGNRKLEGELATSIAEKSSPDIAKLGHQSKVPTINETTDGAGATSPKPRNKDLQEVTTIMTRLYLFTPEKTSSHHVNYLSSMQAVARWVNWSFCERPVERRDFGSKSTKMPRLQKNTVSIVIHQISKSWSLNDAEHW